MTSAIDVYWMKRAMTLAKIAESQDEVPVGAVLVCDDQEIGCGYNRPIDQHDPTHHAEMAAIRQAAQNVQNYRILNSTLYVTLEPCAMCAGAIIQARIERVVFGAFDPKAGACGSIINLLNHSALNHRPSVQGGVLAESCAELLTHFFKQKRLLRGQKPCNASSV